MAAIPKIPIPSLPIFTTPDTPLVMSSQQKIPLADISNDLALFKDGSAALVMETTSLNFGLLSEREQEAVVAAYAALINSLSFPIQILVKTHKKDISSYLEYLKTVKPAMDNPKLNKMIEGYRAFISETITKRKVLGKRFYIVIPFSKFELGVAKSFAQSIQRQSAGPLPYTKEYVLKKAQTALYPKRDHLIRQAGRLGLQLTQLNNEELTRLYFEEYNQSAKALNTNEQIDANEAA